MELRRWATARVCWVDILSSALPTDTLALTRTLYCFQIYLVTHLMGADLNNIIRTQRLTDEHVQFLVYQILRGLKYIHSAGIIHRVNMQANTQLPPTSKKSICCLGLKALEYSSEWRLRAENTRLRFSQAYRNGNDGLCGHAVVQSARDHVKLDALQPNCWYLVCWLYYGRIVNGEDFVSRDRSYPYYTKRQCVTLEPFSWLFLNQNQIFISSI